MSQSRRWVPTEKQICPGSWPWGSWKWPDNSLMNLRIVFMAFFLETCLYRGIQKNMKNIFSQTISLAFRQRIYGRHFLKTKLTGIPSIHSQVPNNPQRAFSANELATFVTLVIKRKVGHKKERISDVNLRGDHVRAILGLDWVKNSMGLLRELGSS